MTFSKLILIISFLSFLGTGCSNNNYDATEGSSSSASSDEKGQNEASGNEDSGDKDDADTENEGEISFTFSANAHHNLLGGTRQVVNYDSVNNAIEVLIPLPEQLSTIGIEGSLPNQPDVTISLDVVRSALVISLPLKNYLDLAKNPTGLPNARPLPGVNGGEPPSFGFPLPGNNIDAYGYAALDSISLYLEFDWKLGFLSARVPIKSEQADKGTIGQLYLLSATNEYRSGLFLTLGLPHELSVLIANAQ